MNYFNIAEFDSPDLPGSGQNMKPKVLLMLEETRKRLGKALHINSGFRSEKHNKKVGGKKSSSHLTGWAVDIHCTTSLDRFEMLKCLIKVGFNRIGIGNTFIHVDIDPEKVENVIWTY